MNRTHVAVLGAALAAPLLMVPAADAANRHTIDFTDHRLGLDSSAVTTDLAECPTAEAVDLRAHVEFTRTHGVFMAVRDFQCGGGTGFVVRLNAIFADGSFGSWSIIDSYGAMEGLQGAGKVTGTRFGGDTEDPNDDGIDDHYTGWITRR